MLALYSGHAVDEPEAQVAEHFQVNSIDHGHAAANQLMSEIIAKLKDRKRQETEAISALAVEPAEAPVSSDVEVAVAAAEAPASSDVAVPTTDYDEIKAYFDKLDI